MPPTVPSDYGISIELVHNCYTCAYGGAEMASCGGQEKSDNWCKAAPCPNWHPLYHPVNYFLSPHWVEFWLLIEQQRAYHEYLCNWGTGVFRLRSRKQKEVS